MHLIYFYAGWREKWASHLETYLRLSYFMNDFPTAGMGRSGDDQIMLDAEVYFPDLLFHVTPYLLYRYFGAVGPQSPHSGSFGWVGAKKQFPRQLFEHDTVLTIDTQLAFSDGALGKTGKDSGFVYGRLILSWRFKLSEHIFLTPHAMWQIADGAQRGGKDDYVEKRSVWVYGGTIEYRF